MRVCTHILCLGIDVKTEAVLDLLVSPVDKFPTKVPARLKRGRHQFLNGALGKILMLEAIIRDRVLIVLFGPRCVIGTTLLKTKGTSHDLYVPRARFVI